MFTPTEAMSSTGIFLDKHMHTKPERKTEDEWAAWDERPVTSEMPEGTINPLMNEDHTLA